MPFPLRSSAVALAMAVAGWLAPPLAVAAGTTGSGDVLARRHAELSIELAQSPFGRPILVRASDSDAAPSGEVLAVVAQPYAEVAAALQRPQNWCALMMLQTNVKRCTPAGDGAEERLEVGIARRYTDPAADAQPVSFRWQANRGAGGYLSVSMKADEGPVGTSDYALRFEAVPIAGDRSFVRLAYDYRTGVAARMATRLYLSTAGRDKVGFSIIGRDDAGRPQYVRGIQGVVERNAMRYFLAIEALLATEPLPAARRLDERLRGFHAALERQPAQLHETELGEYLAMKRREIGAAD